MDVDTCVGSTINRQRTQQIELSPMIEPLGGICQWWVVGLQPNNGELRAKRSSPRRNNRCAIA